MCRSTTANTMYAEGSRPSEGANTSGKGPKGNKKYRMNVARKTFKFLERAFFSQVFYMVSPRKKARGRTRHLGSSSNVFCSWSVQNSYREGKQFWRSK